MLIVGGCRQRRVAEFGGLPAGAVLPIELDSPALRIWGYSVPSAADSELLAPSAAVPELSASTGTRNSGSAALGALNSRIATLGEGKLPITPNQPHSPSITPYLQRRGAGALSITQDLQRQGRGNSIFAASSGRMVPEPAR